MHNLRQTIKSNIKKVLLGIIALAVSVAILGYFYQYSQKSRASMIAIDFKFSQTSIDLSPENPTKQLDIEIFGTNKISGATILVSYPKDILKFDGFETPDICSGLDQTVKTVINEDLGQIAVTKVKPSAEDDMLPPKPEQQFFCFIRLAFRGITSTSSEKRTGKIQFIAGPVGTYEWEVVGPEGVYEPNFAGQEVAVTVTGQNFPTATPTPTTDPNTTLTPNPTQIACTQEVILCPDGITYVGRDSNNNCQFKPCPSPAQTTPSTGVISNITFDIRTQGLTQAAKSVNEIPVWVTFLQGKQIVDERSVSVSKNGDGSWTGTSKYDTLLTGTDYALLIKGPKHLQKKICVNNPSESIGGQYSCADGAVRIQAGDDRLDLKGVTLLAGDLPLQNGIVDAVDISYIRSNLGNSNADVVARGDLNYDGIVDSQDYGIIINALSFKYDEEE